MKISAAVEMLEVTAGRGAARSAGLRHARVHQRTNSCRSGLALPVLLAVVIPQSMAAQSAVDPARTVQTVPSSTYEVVLDAARGRTRRVRTLLSQSPGAAAEAPLLGDWLESWVRRSEVFTGVAQLLTRPDGSSPPFVDLARQLADVTAERIASGRQWEYVDHPSANATSWYRQGASTVSWTVFMDTTSAALLHIPLPAALPLLPTALTPAAPARVWVVEHDTNGAPVRALAFSPTAGAGSSWLRARWERDSVASTKHIEDAIDRVPDRFAAHTLSRYGERDAWRPLRDLIGMAKGVRHNRVQGASLEVPITIDVSPILTARAWVRPAATSYGVNAGGSLVVERWPITWGLDGGRELLDANRWEPAETKRGNSVSSLLFDGDAGHYYTSEGATLFAARRRGLSAWRVEFFGATDRPAAPRTTHAEFPQDETDSLPGLDAQPGTFWGARAILERQLGARMDRGVLVARGWLGATTGTESFGNVGLMVDALRSHRWLAVGVRGAAGHVLAGTAPVQRGYFVGGATTVRGVLPGTLEGPTFALARLEVGVGPAALRVVGFGDAGWAGTSNRLGRASAAGVGLSFGEGILRIDLAHPLERGSGVRFLISGNGLL